MSAPVRDFLPSSKIGALRDLLLNLLQEHERDGTIPTNARFLYYELVQRGQLSKERTGARRSDQNLHDALIDIREDGRVPWDWIIDETRSLEDYTGYPTILEGVLANVSRITLDPWRRRAPLILCESRSLGGVVRSTVYELRARIAATNGQCGGFLRTDVAPMLKPGDDVGYLGDLNLSGGHIEEDRRGADLGAHCADQAASCRLQPAGHHQTRPPLQGWPSTRGGRNRSDQPACADRHPARVSDQSAARAAGARSRTRGTPTPAAEEIVAERVMSARRRVEDPIQRAGAASVTVGTACGLDEALRWLEGHGLLRGRSS
jgi:hypothetical protein